MVKEYHFTADLVCDVNAHDCHEIDHVQKTESSELSDSTFFSGFFQVCCLWHIQFCEDKSNLLVLDGNENVSICKMAR